MEPGRPDGFLYIGCDQVAKAPNRHRQFRAAEKDERGAAPFQIGVVALRRSAVITAG